MTIVRVPALAVIVALFAPACGGGGAGGPVVPGNNFLAALTTNLVAPLSPVFASGVTNYTAGPAVAATVVVTPTAQDALATITVQGGAVTSGAPSPALPLGMGVTNVAIVVTAQNGTQRTYSIAVDRTSAALLGLTASAGSLSPAFASGTLAYEVGPELLPGATTLTPTAEDPTASISVNTQATTSGTASPSISLPMGMTAIDVVVTARDGSTTSTYTVVMDRSLVGQDGYIKASNPGSSDKFGYSVGISGDTLVVSTPHEASGATGINGNQADESAPNSGAAYVFVRSGATWVQQAYLKASNLCGSFGICVAISGNTIVVGAHGEASNATGVNGDQNNTSAPGSGAAYVFTRSGTTWSQQAYLKASNAGAGDGFGNHVAVSGDTIVVGAPFEDSNALGVNGDQANNDAGESGAAYVFVRSGTTWTQQAYLKASNTQSGDWFGLPVTISGDTVAAAAFHEDSDAVGINGDQSDNDAGSSGAVYVFTRAGTTWSQQTYLKASNTAADDRFGSHLDLSGDTIVAGAAGEDSSATGIGGNQADEGAPGSGAAYVFVRSGVTWTQQAYLKASNTGPGDGFGDRLALSGDTIVVGSYLGEDSDATGIAGAQNNDDAPDSGAAYVFTRTGTAWTQVAYVKASNAEAGDNLGIWVDADGPAFVIGSWLEDGSVAGVGGNQADNGSPESGAAYAFR